MGKKKIIITSVIMATTAIMAMAGILSFALMFYNDNAQATEPSPPTSFSSSSSVSSLKEGLPYLCGANSPKSHNGMFIAERKKEDGAYALVIRRLDDNNVTVIVREKPGQDIESQISDFYEPRFSLDDKKVYFRSSAWTTSTAIHELDIATGKVRFITDGNDFIVVPSGEYTGKLAIIKHKYFLGSGSYDWYWLVDPKTGGLAKEDPIGENLSDFFDIYVCKYQL